MSARTWLATPDLAHFGARLAARYRRQVRGDAPPRAVATAVAAMVWVRLSASARRLRRRTTVIVENSWAAAASPPRGPVLLVSPAIERRVHEMTRTLVERIRDRVATPSAIAAAQENAGATRTVLMARPAVTATSTTPARAARAVEAPRPDRGQAVAARAQSSVSSTPRLATERPPAAANLTALPSTLAVHLAVLRGLSSDSRRPIPPSLVIAGHATARRQSASPILASAPMMSSLPTTATMTPLASPRPRWRSRSAVAPPLVAPPALASSAAVTHAHRSGASGRRVAPFVAVAASTLLPVRHASSNTRTLQPSDGPTRARVVPSLSANAPTRPSVAPPLLAPSLADGARIPVAQHRRAAFVGVPGAPRLPPASALPLNRGLLSRKPSVDALPVLHRREKTVDVHEIQEKVTRRIEETLHRQVIEGVETIVAREMAPDSLLARHLSDRIYGGLYESLVLEKERLGWG